MSPLSTPGVFGKYFPKQVEFGLLEDGRYHAEYSAYTMLPDGASLFGPMPWLKDARGEHFACTLTMLPNFALFGRTDLIQPWELFSSRAREDADHDLYAISKRTLRHAGLRSEERCL